MNIGGWHSTIYSKTFDGKTFTVRIKMSVHRKTFIVTMLASFNNECTWLVHYIIWIWTVHWVGSTADTHHKTFAIG